MTPDKDLAARLAKMPKRFFLEPRHHDKGEKLLEIVYADPGNNGFYYRDQKYGSVTAYIRLDLLSQLITRAEADAMVAASVTIDDAERQAMLNIAVSGSAADMLRYRYRIAAAIRSAQPAPAKGAE